MRALLAFLLLLPAVAGAQFQCLPAPCGTGSPLVVRSLTMQDRLYGVVAGWNCPDPYRAQHQVAWATADKLPADWLQTAANLAVMDAKACAAAVAAITKQRFTPGVPMPELLEVERRQVLNALPVPAWVVRTNGAYPTRPTYAMKTDGTRGAQIGTVQIKRADGTPEPCYPSPMRVVEGTSTYGEVKVEQEGKPVELALCSRVQ